MSVRGREDEFLPTVALRRVPVCPHREMAIVSIC